jgi:glycogen synthase
VSLRVLMTADAVGGVFTYCLELAGALGAAGVKVLLAVMGPHPGQAQRRLLDACPRLEWVHREHPLEWMDRSEPNLGAAAMWLLSLERRFEPNVIHLNGYAPAALDWHAPVLMVAHSCNLAWWAAVYGERAPSRFDDYARRVQAGLEAAARVVAPTAAMLRTLERHYGTMPHAQVIHHGRSARGFRAAAKEPFVLTAGSLWDEGTNIAALGAAAPQLPWPVRAAGAKCVLGETAVPTGALELLGPLDERELADMMSRAAIFALPARYEPFGLSVLEAALSGCALVLGDIPSLRELWAGRALFAPPNDAEVLATVIARLIRDEPLRISLAAGARARATRFGTARMASRYVGAYRSLLADNIRDEEKGLRLVVAGRA